MSKIENPVTEVETKPQEQKPTPAIRFEQPQVSSTQKRGVKLWNMGNINKVGYGKNKIN